MKNTKQEDTTSENKTTTKNYKYLIEIGKNILPEFYIDDSNKWIYDLFVAYFANKPENTDYKLDYSKGILLMGNVGTGKSLIFKVFTEIFRHTRYVSTRHIIRDFMINGADVINTYGKNSYVSKSNFIGFEPVRSLDKGNPIYYCFDDLGLENTDSKLYGNQMNVIADILLDRYEEKLITHATTNLSLSALQGVYGDRIRDRFKEMFNLVTLTGESLRK